MFDNGWLLPGNPPEFGGRNASILQQYVHQQELTRRRVYLTFNPQGVGIISASLITFGTPEQQLRWAVPILRAEMTASLGMSEPGAGSDLASLRTAAVRDGDCFVVNGQKVWTSGAHDADVLLTFVRTDPTAPKHRGIKPGATAVRGGPSEMLISLARPGVGFSSSSSGAPREHSLMLIVRNARAGRQKRAGGRSAACSGVATTWCTAHFEAATGSGGACAGAALDAGAGPR